MNNIQKLEKKVLTYANRIGGVEVKSNKDYRQLRKGLRLTYLMNNEITYYEWLKHEQKFWVDYMHRVVIPSMEE